ncbi:MAG: hypothetical protein ACLU5I_06370 [Alistipes finegoldii]
MTEQNINPHLLNEESENTNGITLHDLIQMVLANWYWFALRRSSVWERPITIWQAPRKYTAGRRPSS